MMSKRNISKEINNSTFYDFENGNDTETICYPSLICILEELIDLLSNVIHSLEMTQYEIEDPSEASNVIREADHYHAQMLQILHSQETEDTSN